MLKMSAKMRNLIAITMCMSMAFPFASLAAVVTTTTSTTLKTVSAKSAPMNRIFYYVEGAQARLSFFAYAKYIDVFAPQAYSINKVGSSSGGVASDLLVFSKKNNIKVEPLVVNSGFSSSSVDVFLSDVSAQTSAIGALVTEAQKQGYAGYQLDFEQIDSSDKFKYDAFVKRFGAAMKTAGLISSVAVIAQTSQNPADYPNNIWQTIVGAYDYSSLASSTDFISLMSYDDPNSTGPIAEWSWYKQVLAYALTQVPAKQLSLGLGLYNWQWNENIGKRVGIGGHTGLTEEMDTYKTTQYYSTVQQAPYIDYKIKGIPYTIWFENAQSVARISSRLSRNMISRDSQYGA